MERLFIIDTSFLPKCFSVFQELRPHLTDITVFCNQIIQQFKEGYEIAVIEEGGCVVGCIGYREMTTLAWGKILYIDDLIVASSARGKGCAKDLLDFAKEQAEKKGCSQIHLDTGYHRHTAHRLYLAMGFELNCHHLSLILGV